jgi:hypothetical protein
LPRPTPRKVFNLPCNSPSWKFTYGLGVEPERAGLERAAHRLTRRAPKHRSNDTQISGWLHWDRTLGEAKRSRAKESATCAKGRQPPGERRLPFGSTGDHGYPRLDLCHDRRLKPPFI